MPTCDEFSLSHALDAYRHLARQAYLFAAPADLLYAPADSYRLRLAAVTDVELIEQSTGDLFGGEAELRRKVEKREMFLTFDADTYVGVGVIEPSTLVGEVASVGMFVFEPFRRQGAATTTLRLLVRECRQVSLRPVAGCWVYNHPSKRALERAGLFAQTRLLRIES